MERSFARWALPLGGALLGAAGLAYLLAHSLLSHDPEIDFRFVWLAGHMWQLGENPYSPAYTTLGARLFPAGNPIAYWLYPPQWWTICRPLAALPPDAALVIWRATNAMLAVIAATITTVSLRRSGVRSPLWAMGAAVLYVALLQATPQALSLGQTSILILFGLALSVAGLLGESTFAVAIGLALVLFKPHVGMVELAVLAARPRWWPAIAGAFALTLLLCLPQLIAFGVADTVRDLLHNMGEHATIGANGPENLTGVTQLLWLVGVRLPATIAVLLAMVVGFTLSLLQAQEREASRRNRLGTALLILSCCCLFLPLHTYDAVFFAPLGILMWAYRGAARLLLGAAALLSFRPGNLARHLVPQPSLVGGATPFELLLISLAGLLAFVAVLVALRTPASATKRVQG